jgi:photosystem II stability/assembly factor-like uncharacterized protein/pimeloyl-ACP methyl ester carboxylesterase
MRKSSNVQGIFIKPSFRVSSKVVWGAFSLTIIFLASLLLVVSANAGTPNNVAPTAISAGSSEARGLFTGDGSWVWETPYPVGNNLSSVSCPDENICYAVGDGGIALKTTNRGLSWEKLYSQVASNLNSISCASITMCAAFSGSSGSFPNYSNNFIVTMDGGKSWTGIQARLDSSNSISCPSTTVCYVLETYYSTTYRKFVYNGQNWIASSNLSFIQQGAYEYSTNITCPSELVCYILLADTSVYYFTTNGGSSWDYRSINAAVSPDNFSGNYLSCLDVNTCFAVGSGGKIIKFNHSTGNLVSQNSGTSQKLTRISCVVNSGFCAVSGNNDTILTTDNSGASWNLQTAPANIAKTTVRQLSCGSTTNCLIVGDGGLIWSGPGATWGYPNQTTVANLSKISCPAVETCVALGNKVIAITENAGENWVFLTPNTAFNLKDLNCPNNEVCYIAGSSGAILKLTKSGTGWNIQDSPTNFTEDLRAISCYDASSCFAISNFSRMLRTLNGGATWISSTVQTNSNKLDIDCPAPRNCTLLTDVDVRRTTNNGDEWVFQWNLGVGFSTASLACPQLGSCFAVGNTLLYENAPFFAITPQETTRLSFPGTEAKSLSCPSISTCYVIANTSITTTTKSQRIYITRNGGRSWESQIPGTNSLTNIACVNSTNNCRMVGGGILFNQQQATVVKGIASFDELEKDDLYKRMQSISYSGPLLTLNVDISRYYGLVNTTTNKLLVDPDNDKLQAGKATIYLWFSQTALPLPNRVNVSVNGQAPFNADLFQQRTWSKNGLVAAYFTVDTDQFKFPNVCIGPNGIPRSPGINCLRDPRSKNSVGEADDESTFASITPMTNIIEVNNLQNNRPLAVETGYFYLNGVRPVLLVAGIDASTCNNECIKDTTDDWGGTKENQPNSPDVNWKISNWINWLSIFKLIPTWNPPRDGTKSPEEQTEYLDRGASFLRRVYGTKKFNIIAHSMGGVTSRVFTLKVKNGYNYSVDKLITLNSPHTGVPNADKLGNKAGISLTPSQMRGRNIFSNLREAWALQNNIVDDPKKHVFFTITVGRTNNLLDGERYRNFDGYIAGFEFITTNSAHGLFYPDSSNLSDEEEKKRAAENLPSLYATFADPLTENYHSCEHTMNKGIIPRDLYDLNCHSYAPHSLKLRDWVYDVAKIDQYGANNVNQLSSMNSEPTQTTTSFSMAKPNQLANTIVFTPTQILHREIGSLGSNSVVTVAVQIDQLTDTEIKVSVPVSLPIQARIQTVGGSTVISNQNIPLIYGFSNNSLPPGAYNVIITSGELTTTVPYAVVVEAKSDLAISTEMTPTTFGSSVPGSITVRLSNGSNNTPVIGANVTATLTIQAANGTTTTNTVTLLDNGSNGDSVAGDGNYSIWLPSNLVSETVSADIRASGVFSATNFTRLAFASGQMQSGEARFSGAYNWQTYANALPNAVTEIATLYLDVGLNVQQAGVYEVQSALTAANGQAVATGSATLGLSVGSNNVPVRFDATQIEAAQLPGPYRIATLQIRKIEEFSQRVTDDASSNGSLPVLNLSLDQFKRPALRLAGNPTSVQSDVDGNGQFRKLLVTVPFNVGKATIYRYSAELRSTNGILVGVAFGETNLSANLNVPVVLTFYGSVIRSKVVNGPYQVENLLISDSQTGRIVFSQAKLPQTGSWLATTFSPECNPFIVNSNQDNNVLGTGSCQFTLRQALEFVSVIGEGNVSFELATNGRQINLIDSLDLPYGVNITTDCSNRVRLTAPTSPILLLRGNNLLRGLELVVNSTTSGKPILTVNSSGNKLECTTIRFSP